MMKRIGGLALQGNSPLHVPRPLGNPSLVWPHPETAARRAIVALSLF